ncbi:MAG: ATP-dependent Clp protease proteolytic subunit [Parvularculaceae bacterium]
MSPEIHNRAGVALTLVLFGLLAAFAVESGRRVYETGPAVATSVEAGAVVLRWEGPVAAPMAHRLRAAFETAKGGTERIIVELSSPGGALIEGRAVIEEIGRMKKTHAVAARVRDGEICASMCVPVFLAGETRIAGPESRFLFHEPTSVDMITDEKVNRPAFETSRDAERFFTRYFERSAMDAAWRERLRQNWKGRDIWKTGLELVAEGSGVVTELSP